MAKIFNFLTIEEKNPSYRSLRHKKCHKRQNDRVDIVWCIFKKIKKKIGIEVTGPKNKFSKNEFFRSCDFIYKFFPFFTNNFGNLKTICFLL